MPCFMIRLMLLTAAITLHDVSHVNDALCGHLFYIVIHDYDNPVTQHGLASYVTKLKAKASDSVINMG